MTLTQIGPSAHGPRAYGRSVTSYRQPGTVRTDHTFGVPLDYGRPDGGHIEVSARDVVAAGQADAVRASRGAVLNRVTGMARRNLTGLRRSGSAGLSGRPVRHRGSGAAG